VSHQTTPHGNGTLVPSRVATLNELQYTAINSIQVGMLHQLGKIKFKGELEPWWFGGLVTQNGIRGQEADFGRGFNNDHATDSIDNRSRIPCLVDRSFSASFFVLRSRLRLFLILPLTSASPSSADDSSVSSSSDFGQRLRERAGVEAHCAERRRDRVERFDATAQHVPLVLIH
jgi:hypothetical protein